MDRRILKTRKIIKDSFIELINEIGFEKITVKNLTERANINRGTFYLHYTDKYDLLEQSENEILEEIDAILTSASKSFDKIFILNSIEPIHNFLAALYSYVGDNADLMPILLKDNNNSIFINKLKDIINNCLRNIFPNTEVLPKQIKVKYLVEIISSIHVGIIKKWLEDGMIETPDEIATMLDSIITNLITGMVKNNNLKIDQVLE